LNLNAKKFPTPTFPLLTPLLPAARTKDGRDPCIAARFVLGFWNLSGRRHKEFAFGTGHCDKRTLLSELEGLDSGRAYQRASLLRDMLTVAYEMTASLSCNDIDQI